MKLLSDLKSFVNLIKLFRGIFEGLLARCVPVFFGYPMRVEFLLLPIIQALCLLDVSETKPSSTQLGYPKNPENAFRPEKAVHEGSCKE